MVEFVVTVVAMLLAAEVVWTVFLFAIIGLVEAVVETIDLFTVVEEVICVCGAVDAICFIGEGVLTRDVWAVVSGILFVELFIGIVVDFCCDVIFNGIEVVATLANVVLCAPCEGSGVIQTIFDFLL